MQGLYHIFKEIKSHCIDIKDITYVLATHYHPDHIGLVSELQKIRYQTFSCRRTD